MALSWPDLLESAASKSSQHLQLPSWLYCHAWSRVSSNVHFLFIGQPCSICMGRPFFIRANAQSSSLLTFDDRPLDLSLIHISEPTRQAEISYAVFCLKK